jgi:hypothetical protein
MQDGQEGVPLITIGIGLYVLAVLLLSVYVQLEPVNHAHHAYIL